MVSEANERLIRDYLDIAVNAPEDIGRFTPLLRDDCIWHIVPPGVSFSGKAQVMSFANMAMGSRTHNADYKIEIHNWFADGDNFCVEYFHGAILGPFHIKVTEIVCLVCHMRDGQFDSVHEYVDTSQSILIGVGLKLLPLIVKLRSFTARPTG